jgi:zinc protease
MLGGILLLGICIAAVPAIANDHSDAAHTLANGMKIVVHEDHRIPNIALYLFFRVGSANERPGITGLSHFLEHMMFNGSRKYGPQEFDRVMEKHGASNNAYTTRDVTVYSDWLSRSSVELVLSMEAERLSHLTFSPEVMESERKVVLSERRTTVENDNFGYLDEALFSALYQKHSYRWPVLGWVADIQRWTVADLREYFQRGYGPDNCVMVAAGDVRTKEFLALVEKYFAALPARGSPQPASPAEPEQREERRVEIERQAQAPQQLIAYRVPPSAHPDYWPLQVASSVLASGHSSRLYRRLVRHDQFAVSVSSWVHLSLAPGELMLNLNLKRQADPTKAGHALDEEMEELSRSDVSSRELRAAKNRLLTEHAHAIRTNSGRAEWLGTYEIFFGDFRKLYAVPQAIEQVTAADVRRVARAYLVPQNRTVATLRPVAVVRRTEPVQ